MKTCVCEGRNENCRYCGGSGSVPDDMGLPQPPSDIKAWVPESQSVSEPRPEGTPSFGMQSRSSFRSEAVGCFWSVAIQLIIVFVVFLILKLLLGK
jgi:hypothetical protein